MKNVYTVKQVNSYIKNMFTQDFMLNRIYVKGEVSNLKYHTSGHIYFSLKDESGTIACVMFAGSRSGLSFHMEEGQQVDVMIVGRGGGSIEDLWAFNEEAVARAIFDCRVPVISAVGHETDTTIADYVADLRAPTPSAAAELAVYEYSEVKEQILNCESLLRRAINQKLLNERVHLEHSRLKLQTLHPRQKLNEKRQRTVDAENTLRSLMERHLTKEKHRLALCAERMKGLSPLEKLSQGYSYVCNAQGQNIKKTDQVREGDLLQIYVTDGQIETYVTDTVKLEGERGQSSHKQ